MKEITERQGHHAKGKKREEHQGGLLRILKRQRGIQQEAIGRTKGKGKG